MPGTEKRCLVELTKVNNAARILSRFLAHGQYNPQRIKFAQLSMAPMDEVSVLNKVFAHNKRHPRKGEWILLEELIHEHGSLVCFVNCDGRMYRDRTVPMSDVGLSMVERSEHPCSLESREMIEAFVHYSYITSEKTSVVCGLEGIDHLAGCTVLKTPIIHSEDKRFGETDQGKHGIDEVMRRHRCNQYCRRVLRMRHCASASAYFMTRPIQLSSPFVQVSKQKLHFSTSTEESHVAGFGIENCSTTEPTAPPCEDVGEFCDNLGSTNCDRLSANLNDVVPMIMVVRVFSLEGTVASDPPPPYHQLSELHLD